MRDVLVFGGTTEGRELAEWLSERGSAQVTVSTATEYGGELVADRPRVKPLSRRLGADDMAELMATHAYACVVDATHPYAAHVSDTIERVARETGTPLIRLLREGEPEGDWTSVSDVRAAARAASQIEGKILLTTGSKDLATFAAAVSDFSERVYVRILPVARSLEHASELGVRTDHVIAMQGPFSRALNRALIDEFDIAALVTKASGETGGFWEKIGAARDCGIAAIVIRRPRRESGLSYEQTKEKLVSDYGF